MPRKSDPITPAILAGVIGISGDNGPVHLSLLCKIQFQTGLVHKPCHSQTCDGHGSGVPCGLPCECPCHRRKVQQ